ncbi:hypothetical protein [Rhodoplanes elegans]|uniref:hypothetical protein n=1 Tax=Rhodoplanes elegans TaxID=29408 RepID=UPI0011B93F73|nr:hypothetical protein [Rhodoplanes elegans]
MAAIEAPAVSGTSGTSRGFFSRSINESIVTGSPERNSVITASVSGKRQNVESSLVCLSKRRRTRSSLVSFSVIPNPSGSVLSTPIMGDARHLRKVVGCGGSPRRGAAPHTTGPNSGGRAPGASAGFFPDL